MSTEFAISRFCVPFINPEGWALFADCDILCWSDIQELFDLANDKYAVMVVKHREANKLQEPFPHGISHDGTLNHSECNECRQLALEIKKVGNAFVAGTKMDGQIQTYYSRKNWSSVVLWNCDHPSNKRLRLMDLRPDGSSPSHLFVPDEGKEDTHWPLNTWPGRDLHAFKWLNDDEIGELPQHWNWLINVIPGNPEAKGIWHYTLGTPTFADYERQPYSEQWLAEYERLRFTKV